MFPYYQICPHHAYKIITTFYSLVSENVGVVFDYYKIGKKQKKEHKKKESHVFLLYFPCSLTESYLVNLSRNQLKIIHEKEIENQTGFPHSLYTFAASKQLENEMREPRIFK